MIILSKPASMARVLARDYADFPLAALPEWGMHLLVRTWRSRSDVVFLEARDSEDRYLGFIFGHSLGERPWRALLLGTPLALPAVIWVYARRRLRRWFLPATLSYRTYPAILDEGPVPSLAGTPYLKVEFISVTPEARGKQVGRHLLRAFEDEARAGGLSRLEADISEANTASVKAFRHAGWAIYREARKSLRAIRQVAVSQ